MSGLNLSAPQVSVQVPVPAEGLQGQGQSDQIPQGQSPLTLITRGSSPSENRSQRRAPVLPVVEAMPQIPEVDLTLDEEMIFIEDDQD